MRPFGHHQHLGGVPRVEAGVGCLGQHRHGPFRVRLPRGRGQDRVTAHHRPAAGRDVAPELVDLDKLPRVVRRGAGLVEQRHGTVGQPGQPPCPGRLPQQPHPPAAVGGQPPGPLERGGRGRVRTAVPGPGARLLQRRRRRLVGARRRGGQVPGAAVHVPVRQGGRERTVRAAPLVGGRVGVDRQPGQRMAELHHAREQRDQPHALGVGQRGQVDAEPGRGLLQRRQIGGVAGRGQDQGLLRGLAELARAVQERL